MKLGTARTTQTYNNLLHIIKLETYRQTIDKINDSLINFDHIEGLNSTLKTTKIRLNEVQYKLQTLLPTRHRNKRGLINGLGTIIKFISGNMDANDAERLNEQINTIMYNQSNMKTEINEQTVINKKMIQRFENITDHINLQQEIIGKYLRQTQESLKNRIREQNHLFQHFQFLNEINYNIDILNNHLTNIAEAITLAKLNIISKQILNPEELSEIHKIFENQSVKIKSDEHIYELLGLQAYYNDTNIIFNIQIPIFLYDTYSFFHIIPIPIEKTKRIVTKPFVILNTNDIHYFDEKCKEIEHIFYCRNPTHRGMLKNSDCIHKLINNNPAHCELFEEDESSEIYQPESNHILLINVPETTINSTCEFGPKVVNGTALIRYENCQVQINGIIYEGQPKRFWDEIYIHPVLFNEINFTINNQNLTFQKLKSYNFENRKEIELLRYNIFQKDILAYCMIAILGIIVITIPVYYNRSSYKHSIDLPNPASPTGTIKTQFLFPSLSPKDGGVTYSP